MAMPIVDTSGTATYGTDELTSYDCSPATRNPTGYALMQAQRAYRQREKKRKAAHAGGEPIRTLRRKDGTRV